MFELILRIFLTVIGFVGGHEIFKAAFPSLLAATGFSVPLSVETRLPMVGGAILGLICYFVTPSLVVSVNKLAVWTDSKIKTVPTQDIILGAAGLIIALLIGVLLNFPLQRIPWLGPYLSPAVTLILSYLGITIILSRKDEFAFLSAFFLKRSSHQERKKLPPVKILDTSVIIDGRIMDISKTGFMEGEIAVPGFVLEELRHIADSPDLLKRNRGRRGLDILNTMQKEMDIEITIINKDYEDTTEVDNKLIKLAQETSGIIVTNDYNLNKVCELQGVSVFNINELANAVKPVVLPGEEMRTQIIKDGKEAGQGVAYLDDGTMVVVEGGRRYIGETVDVLVTSVLQTAAGRMIFAKPKGNFTEKITLKQ